MVDKDCRQNGATLPSNDVDEARARLARALIRTGLGDREAFGEVYTLTSAKLFGICLRICRNQQASEDALHDVYVAVWKNAANWNPSRGSPITWLATIARNRSIDWHRAHGSSRTTELKDAALLPDLSPNAESVLVSRETHRNMHACLAQLDSRYRDAIREAFFDGVTYAELAERRGIPLGTMKSWIRRGLMQMSDHLRELETPGDLPPGPGQVPMSPTHL